jgi:hypothetical protein
MDISRSDGGRDTAWLGFKSESEPDSPAGQEAKMSTLEYKLDLHPGDSSLARPFGPRARMYRFNRVITLASTSLALLILFPLVWTFGFSGLTLSNGWGAFGVFGDYEGPLRARRGDQFLIGVGKADITGYESTLISDQGPANVALIII